MREMLELNPGVKSRVNRYLDFPDYTDEELCAIFRMQARKNRERVIIVTKGCHPSPWRQDRVHDFDLEADINDSLCKLQTDYIDIYQFHNPAFCPMPGGEDGLYDEAMKAKKEGKIRFISITNHRLGVAREAIASGLYASLQFPYSYLSGKEEESLVEGCREKGMGFIAMKGMAGGLIRDGLTAAAYMETKPGVVPIWGVQREAELDQFLSAVKNGALLTEERLVAIEKDRAELCGDFCRGCGYCMPCPQGIQINQCARMVLMARRAGERDWKTEYWQSEMKKVENCVHCNQCASKCPYGLDTPALLRENYEEYWKILAT